MVMRISFTLDPELVDMIDQYAKTRSLKREKAILELIEAGITHVKEGGVIDIDQCRTFEELDQIINGFEKMDRSIAELKKEVRLMHHTIEKEWNKESSIVPFQTSRWWRFWK
jgi:hypothetical protein